MLTRLALTNFQSHSNTSLELGRFTVIVGPSSSGKSAVARAIWLLVANSNGTPYVRHGSRKARVSAAFVSFDGDPLDAQIQVAVERGPGVSKYELVIPGEDLIEFTKCGKTVPDMIRASHDLDPDGMWLAGQFDRPFLLDETGSAVARTLGDLTNVSMIFAAVRECNRRASGAKAKHSDRSEILNRVRVSLQSFADLPSKLVACTAAEESLANARAIELRRDRLIALLDEVETSHVRVVSARAQLRSVPDIASLLIAESRRSRLAHMVRTVEDAASRRAAIRLVTPPDVSSLVALSERRTLLRTMLTGVVQSELSRRQAVNQAALARVAVEEARSRLKESLTQAGACPVCGAAAEHAQLDRVTG
jgi:energy-coupling factor transporter ATP-binding protein EcfA2